MEKVDIYDIASGSWYTQATTRDPAANNGDSDGFPKPRMMGCIVAASAPDNSSHQIYMHSGAGKLYGDSFDDVWVLSLPMFRWKRVSENVFGFFGHTCHVVGNNRYMVTLGGYREANWCENLLYVYDLSGLSWVDNYYPNTPYTVPLQISAIIGGSFQGGATVTSPEAGWDNNVEAVFRSQTSSRPSPSASPSPKPKSKSNKIAILGGVLGGLLGVAAVLSAVLFYLRRRHLREAAPQDLKPAALSEADSGAESPQRYDAGSAWIPPQELSSDVMRVEAGHQQDGELS